MQIGEICLEAGFDIPAHKQHCCEISYVFSGKGIFEHNGIKTDVSAGDIIISPADGVHTIYASQDDAFFYSYVGFKFNGKSGILPENTPEAFNTDGHLVCRDTVGIYDYYKKCMDEFYRSGEIDTPLIESYLLQIILLTLRSSKYSSQQYDYQSHSETPGKLVYLIMKYVDLNIEKPLTVHGIAESLGYSIYHISHTFKEKTDITLQDYIANKKTEKAKEMMLRGRLTLTEIADKLGYMSIQSFSRSFKKKEGVSPSEYINNSK